MIYTKTSFNQRQRIVSGDDQKSSVKSPVRVVRLSTSPPNKFYCTSNQRARVISQPYHYQPPTQQSAHKLAFFAKSPQKVPQSQTVHINPTPPANPASSSSKPMTLKERLWAKHKHQAVEEYNIWEGYQSQTSIQEPQNPSKTTISQMLSSKNLWNFHKKSISKPAESSNQPEIRRVIVQNEGLRSPTGHLSPLSPKYR